LRRVSHRAAKAIDKAIDEFRFNSAIATIYEWVNALKKAEASGDLLGARAEAVSMLARCLTPFMPHLAESVWQRIGGAGFVSAAAWPEPDPALITEDTVTLAVQVNGKRRGEITVPKDLGNDAVEAAARALPEVAAFIDGKGSGEGSAVSRDAESPSLTSEGVASGAASASSVSSGADSAEAASGAGAGSVNATASGRGASTKATVAGAGAATAATTGIATVGLVAAGTGEAIWSTTNMPCAK
jgi:hypothetical protein